MTIGNELKVFISNRDSKCDECGEDLGRREWITLLENKGALCLTCADLDHLDRGCAHRQPAALLEAVDAVDLELVGDERPPGLDQAGPPPPNRYEGIPFLPSPK